MTIATEFRVRPTVVQAAQLDPGCDLSQWENVQRWVNGMGGDATIVRWGNRGKASVLYIRTSEGTCGAEGGDWVIWTGGRRFSVCPEREFTAKYEAAS